MIKSIIFDFDGVLVDSEILVAKAFSRYMIESGYDFNQNEFSKYAGKKTFQVISDLSEKFSIKDEEKFYNDIMNIASDIYSKELITVKGAFEYVKNSINKLNFLHSIKSLYGIVLFSTHTRSISNTFFPL